MTDTIRRVEYCYVTVPDKPGAGLRVLSPLKEAGVNLLAYLGFPSARGKAQIDLVLENSAALKRVAATAGLKLSRVKRTFLIQGDDRAGAVADVMGKLAEARINVTASAAASAGAGRYGMIVWVPPTTYEKAAKALGV